MERQILVLGIGNTLLSDDGIGVHVIEALRRREREGTALPLVLRDGGTLGLSLLPEIERCTALVLIDAVELGAPPGEVRSFEGTAMDALLAGRKRSPHAVGIADLERCTALVLIDAVELGAPPGEVRSFEGTAMDALLAGRKRSPHAVGIAD